MVHQHFTLAENLDALDNIMLGSERFFDFRRNKTKAMQKVQKIMDDSGLAAPMNIPVGKLTVGERQRVEILKALYQDVKILVLDEPTAVLTPQESDKLFENIYPTLKKKHIVPPILEKLFLCHQSQQKDQ